MTPEDFQEELSSLIAKASSEGIIGSAIFVASSKDPCRGSIGYNLADPDLTYQDIKDMQQATIEGIRRWTNDPVVDAVFLEASGGKAT